MTTHDIALIPGDGIGILERGFLLTLRAALHHAVNLRPVRLYPGVSTPIADLTPERCDIAIVRENTEGPYVGGGTTVHRGTGNTIATEISINSEKSITELVTYGFRLAPDGAGGVAGGRRPLQGEAPAAAKLSIHRRITGR